LRIRSASLLDGRRWDNDWAADGYVSNGFGGDDSVVDLTALAEAVPRAARNMPAKESSAGDGVGAGRPEGSRARCEASQEDSEIARRGWGGIADGIESPHCVTGPSGLFGRQPCSW